MLLSLIRYGVISPILYFKACFIGYTQTILGCPKIIATCRNDETKNAKDWSLSGNPIARDRPAFGDCRPSTSRGW